MHAPLHHDYLVPLLRGAAFCFLVFFFWAGSRQSCAFRCVSVSSPAVACLSSIVAGCPRPWGVVVVEADVGRALLLFVRLRGFGTPSPFLGVLRTFPRVTDLHRSVTPWDCLFRRSQLYFSADRPLWRLLADFKVDAEPLCLSERCARDLDQSLTPHSIDTLFRTIMSDPNNPRESHLKHKFADHPHNNRYGDLRLGFMISCY